jgi:hypothetical protein
MVIDLHVVVPQGGDSATLDRLLNAGIESGLDGLCLFGAGAPPPMEAARTSRFAGRLALYFGIEFPLERGRLLWIPEDPAALDGEVWRDAVGEHPTLASVAAVRERCGGVVLAAHPYERLAGPAFVDSVFALKNIDGVVAATAALDRVRNRMALEAAQRLNLAALGGSGSVAGPAEIGLAASVFPGEALDQATLVAMLRRKDAWTVELLSRPDQLEPEDEGGRDRDRGRGSSRGGRDSRGEFRPGDRGERRPDGRNEPRPDGRNEPRPDPRNERRPDGRDQGRGDPRGAPRGDPRGERPRGPGGPMVPSGAREPRGPQGPAGGGVPGEPAAEGGPGRRRHRRRGGGGRGSGEGGGPPSSQAPSGGNVA